MADVSCYQDAFHIYMTAMGKENMAMFLPDSQENRATRNTYLNCCRMAWKANVSSIPKEFRGDMENIKFFSAEKDGMLYVYADKKKEKFTLLKSEGSGKDEFDSYLF